MATGIAQSAIQHLQQRYAECITDHDSPNAERIGAMIILAKEIVQQDNLTIGEAEMVRDISLTSLPIRQIEPEKQPSADRGASMTYTFQQSPSQVEDVHHAPSEHDNENGVVATSRSTVSPTVPTRKSSLSGVSDISRTQRLKEQRTDGARSMY